MTNIETFTRYRAEVDYDPPWGDLRTLTVTIETRVPSQAVDAAVSLVPDDALITRTNVSRADGEEIRTDDIGGDRT